MQQSFLPDKFTQLLAIHTCECLVMQRQTS